MNIIYFAHSVLNRGGDKMVLAHLAHLAESGNHVRIRANVFNTHFAIHPAISIEKPIFASKLGTLVSALIETQGADCVIASIVPTAVFLSLRNRGRVVHFAQDDNETASSSPLFRILMRALYFLAFSVFTIPTITVSQALADTFAKRFGANCRVVSNGVDTNVFFPDPSTELIASKVDRKSILLLSHSDSRKGFDLARRVVERLVETAQIPFEVWTVGEEVTWDDFTGICRYFGNLNEDMLRKVMSSADVFLYPSRSEGFGLMVLESFACRCPVVTTEAVTYARHGENAMVSRIGDVDSLAELVMGILTDEDLTLKITEGGYHFALGNGLKHASALFEVKMTTLLSMGISMRTNG